MKTQRYLSDCLFCNCVTEFPVQIRNDGGERSVTVIQEQGRQLRWTNRKIHDHKKKNKNNLQMKSFRLVNLAYSSE